MTSVKKVLDSYMSEEIEGKRHLGLSLGVFSKKKEMYFNYGNCGDISISEHNYFEIASISKIFTSILILKLAVESLISLDDLVETYIPEISVKGQIRIKDLLTHTAGLRREPSNFEFIAPENSYFSYTDEKLLNDVRNIILNSNNVGKFSYSNYGYILLGLLAKRVTTSKSFKTLLLNQVIAPMGLNQTVFDLNEGDRGKLCWGHDYDLKPVSPYFDLGETFSSAGALTMTTQELLKFCKLLLAPENLDKVLQKSIKQLFDISKDSDGNPLSPGFHVRADKNNNPVFYHPGNIAGHKICVLVSPRRNRAIVYNTTTLQHIKVVWEIFELK